MMTMELGFMAAFAQFLQAIFYRTADVRWRR
jgi:hypothetical protein